MRQPTLTSPIAGLIASVRHSVAPRVFAAVPLGADPLGSIPEGGVGLRFTPAISPAVALRDWLEAQVLRAGHAVEPYLANDYAVAVHWPTVLRSAFVTSDGHTSPHARRLLRLLSPYFRHVDPVLAEYLREDELDESRKASAYQHVERLVATPLGHRLCRALVEVTHPIRDTAATKKFRRCQPCLQRIVEFARYGSVELEEGEDEDRCVACAARKPLAKYSSVIEPRHGDDKRLGLVFLPSLSSVLPRTPPQTQVPPVADDIRWLLACSSDYDGAWREGSCIGVNWAAVGGGVSKERVLAAVARFDAVNQEATDRLADENRTVLRVSALRAALQGLLSPGAVSRRKRLAEARRFSATSPRQRQYVKLQYDTAAGPVDIHVRRHGSRWCLRVPMTVPVGVALPRRVRLQRSADVAEVGSYWWYPSDLREFIASCNARNCSAEADATGTLLAWFEGHITMFLRDPKLFRESRYSSSQEERLGAVMTGQRLRLGRFSQAESDALEQFCVARSETDSGRALCGPFTELEWERVQALLPCRSRATINTKVVELGFKYAKLHGYVAYLASGFGISKTARRRAAWLAKGVKL